jgi:hypothetical protein
MSTVFAHLNETIITKTDIHATQIFLSYARRDNRQPPDYVTLRTDDPITALQTKLARIGFPLWRDTHDIYGGEGWWEQIQRAIEKSDALVVCLSANWLASDVARKERLYALELGIPVLPILIDTLPDDAPPWVADDHYYNVSADYSYHESQWDNFVRNLANPQARAKVPFMPEKLSRDFVARPAELDAVAMALLTNSSKVGISTAFRGSGGYGKTTLARAICHEPRVREHFRGGILWIQQKEDFGDSDLILQVRKAIEALGAEAPSMTTPTEAQKALQAAIGDKRILVVVDDVWSRSMANPFENLGAKSATLFTTRNTGVLPQDTFTRTVDAMTPSEARAMLVYALKQDETNLKNNQVALDALAQRLGRWALLLKLANKQLFSLIEMKSTLKEALAMVNEGLDEDGFGVLDDPDNPDLRYRAVSACLGVTLKNLSEEERKRFGKLAIFPEDTPIPLTMLGKVWGLNALKIIGLVRRFNELSLLLETDLEQQHIRLHDVIRQYLRDQHHDQLITWQAEFLQALGAYTAFKDEYAWRNLAYHLLQAQQSDVLVGLLSNFEFLQAKLNATDVNAILGDFDLLKAPLTPKSVLEEPLSLNPLSPLREERDFRMAEDEILLPSPISMGARAGDGGSFTQGNLRDGGSEGLGDRGLSLLRSALFLSANALNEDKNALAHQLVGRLMGHRATYTGIRAFTDWIADHIAGIYPINLDDEYTTHLPAGGALIRTLEGHTSAVTGAIELSNGDILSWVANRDLNTDQVLWLWSSLGEALAILEGHTSNVNGVIELSNGNILSWCWESIRIWSSDGDELKVLKGHTSGVNGVRVLPNSLIVSWASGYNNKDTTLRLWSSSGEAFAVLKGHISSVSGVRVLKDGRILSWAGGYNSRDYTLRLWSPEGEPIAVLEGHTDKVYGALELSDGRILSWSADKTLCLWLPEGRIIAYLQGHWNSIKGAIELSDGHVLSWAEYYTTLRLWSSNGDALAVLEGHTSRVWGAIELSNKHILSWSSDKTLRLWLPDGKSLTILEGHTNGVNGAIELSNGNILSWSRDNTLRLWSSNGDALAVLEGHTSSVNGAKVLSNGNILSWSDDKTLRLWDTGAESLPICKRHQEVLSDVKQLSNRRILTLSGWKLELWTSDGQALGVLEGHTDGVNDAIELSDGRILSWSKDKTLRLWSSNGVALAVLEGHNGNVEGVTELSDGRILSWDNDATLRLWSSNGEPVSILEKNITHINGVRELSNRYILLWSNYTIWLWSLENVELKVLKGHRSNISNVNELVDGRFLSWSGGKESKDNRFHIWSLSGKKLAVVVTPSQIAFVHVLSDGRILSQGYDKTLHLWTKDGQAIDVLDDYNYKSIFAWAWKHGFDANEIYKHPSLSTLPNHRVYKKDKTLSIYDEQTGKPRHNFIGDAEIMALEVLEDGTMVIGDSVGRVLFLGYREPKP